MNSTFHWAKGFGYGVLLWLVMFAITSALVGFESMDTVWGQSLTIGVAGILAFIFTFGTRVSDVVQALGYGFLWVAVGILLDLLVTYQFNPDIFSAWQYWVSYSLVFLAPVAQIALKPAMPKHSLA